MDGYHDRTRQYLGGATPQHAVRISSSSDATESPTGQLVVLSLVNMVARVHPGLALDLDDRPLAVTVPGVQAATTLEAAAAELALAARPDLELLSPHPSGELPSIGVGARARADRHVVARRWTGFLASEPTPWEPGAAGILGGGLAAAFAASWAMRASLGLDEVDRPAASLWSLDETAEATGPADPGRIDFDDTLILGAGAVASSLGWWAAAIGHDGAADIVDRDVADPSNLSRNLVLFADDLACDGRPALHKAATLAQHLPGTTPVLEWWHEHQGHLQRAPRIVLALANDHGVRTEIGAWGHPVVMHATTGHHWTAELHRHLRLECDDDCIGCRFHGHTKPVFACGSGDLPAEHDDTGDAALPFLSATAGLLLAAALLQHQFGELQRHRPNHWTLAFEPRRVPFDQARHTCSTIHCPAPSPAITAEVFGQ